MFSQQKDIRSWFMKQHDKEKDNGNAPKPAKPTLAIPGKISTAKDASLSSHVKSVCGEKVDFLIRNMCIKLVFYIEVFLCLNQKARPRILCLICGCLILIRYKEVKRVQGDVKLVNIFLLENKIKKM